MEWMMIFLWIKIKTSTDWNPFHGEMRRWLFGAVNMVTEVQNEKKNGRKSRNLWFSFEISFLTQTFLFKKNHVVNALQCLSVLNEFIIIVLYSIGCFIFDILFRSAQKELSIKKIKLKRNQVLKKEKLKNEWKLKM